MEDNLIRFLTESPMAAKIRLPSAVVIRRMELTPRDVMEIKRAGAYGPIPARGQTCELVVGGQRIAFGKIVRRKGAYYFKATGIAGGENTNEEAKR